MDTDQTLDFKINSSTTTLKKLVVTALGNKMVIQRAPVPVNFVSHDLLLQQSSTNIIDAIAREPGITAITTGPGVSKPRSMVWAIIGY